MTDSDLCHPYPSSCQLHSDLHPRCTPRLLLSLIPDINLQATKLFILTSATKGGVVTTTPRFSVRFKILYRVIEPLIQHCLMRRMVYLNVICVIATRNYEFFTTGIVP